ncbi:hypothetical protein WDZ92_37695, partial [Nostoc sp. NIES-2111]
MNPLSLGDVAAYLKATGLNSKINEQQQQRVFEKSLGHPLYLAYLCQQLNAVDIIEEILGEDFIIGDSIESYYRKIWEPISLVDELVELLGFMARITGSVRPEFMKECSPKAGAHFKRLASHLFDLSGDGYTIFHNSFRLFLLQETAFDHFTASFDIEKDSTFHTRLADLYSKSKVEPDWDVSYHLYKAGNIDGFIANIDLEKLGKQRLEFRPAEDIRRDVILGLELARQRKDSCLLSRCILALSELSHREFNQPPIDLVEMLISLGLKDRARRFIRDGRRLRVDSIQALSASEIFWKYGDRSEALLLFDIATPPEIQESKILVSSSREFDSTKLLLKKWVGAAYHQIDVNS